jgi:hypothetical protein
MTCGFGAAATCTDTTDDQNNCGGCGTTCGTFANRYCNGSGVCAPTPGDTDCTGGGLTLAVNLSEDGNNCGACGKACTAGQVCSKGACVATGCGTLTACPAYTPFGGAGAANSCVDTNTDPVNCGGCGSSATGPTSHMCRRDQVCVAGTCRDYLPALGCSTCPCAECGKEFAGSSVCCPKIGTQKEAICVAGTVCP